MSPNLHEIQRYYWPVTFVTDQHKVLQGNALGQKASLWHPSWWTSCSWYLCYTNLVLTKAGCDSNPRDSKLNLSLQLISDRWSSSSKLVLHSLLAFLGWTICRTADLAAPFSLAKGRAWSSLQMPEHWAKSIFVVTGLSSQPSLPPMWVWHVPWMVFCIEKNGNVWF